MAAATARFAAWQHLPQVGPLVPTDSGNAIRLAVDEHGGWRGHALFVSDLGFCERGWPWVWPRTPNQALHLASRA